MRILDLEFFRHPAASFGTQDLLGADPTIFIHEVEPAPKHGDSKIEVPFDDWQKVKPLILEESAGKEGPRGGVA